MDDLDTLRTKINRIDDQLMALLDERFKLVKAVGNVKRNTTKVIEDKTRESDILTKAEQYMNVSQIIELYTSLFTISKNLQRK